MVVYKEESNAGAQVRAARPDAAVVGAAAWPSALQL
jgi:hypothetical protein